MDFMKAIYQTSLVEDLLAANHADEIIALLKEGTHTTTS